MLTDHGIKYKYLRIHGRVLAENTMYPKGFFAMIEKIANDGTMDEEDRGLFEELDKWFAEILPFPPPCQRGEKVVCFFKTENTEEMMKLVRPLLWLLDRYKQPYYLVYTNYPGEIVYEDEYQVVVKVSDTEIEKVVKKTTGISDNK